MLQLTSRRRASRAVLQCLLGLVVGRAGRAQAPHGQGASRTMVRRRWQLTAAGVARVYAELLSIADTSTYERIRVRAGESLRGIVYQRYGVGDAVRPRSNRVVREAIA